MEVQIAPVPLERLTVLLEPERVDRFQVVAQQARELLAGRVVWNVNSTSHGGGVAEMLQTLLSYGRGAGVDTRWRVLSGGPEFFTVTKRLHNQLHGAPGDGGPLDAREHAVMAETTRAGLDELVARVRPGDVVLLHDPQTAGLVAGMRAAGAAVVWRCHIGSDVSNEHTERAWDFLRPLVQDADALVFSRRGYAPSWCDAGRLHVITPSIDPFSTKNEPLAADAGRAVLVSAGLLDGDPGPGSLDFVRRDGARARVRRHQGLVEGGAVPADARLVLQVSRWDRLKDMSGVLTGFADALGSIPTDVHLVLAGPDVDGVTDDPEGAQVLRTCRELWRGLDRAHRDRVHLVRLPMDDGDENAHLVNALQRRAEVVVQKSLVEGFGLTVAEAMWKDRAVLATAVGGIQDQIVDGRDGLLLDDPHDLGAYAQALVRLLGDPQLRARLGAAAHERVYQDFLGDRHLEAWVALFEDLLERA